MASEIKIKYYGQDTLHQVCTALPIMTHLTLPMSRS